MPFNRYNAEWADEYKHNPLAIELACIRKGGQWTAVGGRKCGQGLEHHFMEARKIIWPKLDDHRWNRDCLREMLHAKISVLMGAGSSGKTHTAAWVSLVRYYCNPQKTCILVSSTDMRSLDLRIWGEIKSLHEQAKDRLDWLPGILIDSKHTITTDDIEGDGRRDLRKGIIGIPCVQNGKFVGISRYVGIKSEYMFLVADEAQFMGISFMDSISNLNNNAHFQATVLGNPNELLDCLGKCAEPKEGWTAHMDHEKTAVWDTRFMNGRCVNLIGTDSPNFDYPENEPDRYKYLIGRKKIAEILQGFGKDSVQYLSMCVGRMRIATMNRSVITRDMCVQFSAMEDVVWKGTTLTKIGAMDSAYGGDRCVGGYIEFGEDINGKTILLVHPPVIVPIKLRRDETPEDYIAQWTKDFCEVYDIPPENWFHDSTGRGSLGTALARIWSAQTNPVEFGGSPSARPVTMDMYIVDKKTNEKRLKTCNEHYSKFVTELWYSVRYTIEAGQMRGLPEDVMEEGCLRRWEMVSNNRIEIEPKSGTATKPGMKERTGRSPDLFDWLAICVEGARRRGFQIARLGSAVVDNNSEDFSFAEDAKKWRETIQSKRLQYA